MKTGEVSPIHLLAVMFISVVHSKIQEHWPKKSILAENILGNTREMCLKSNIK